MNRTLGIDYGEARIGLAVSDQLGLMAHPFRTLPNNSQTLNELAAIVAKESVDRIVLGLPKNMDGTLGASAARAQSFGQRVLTRLPDVPLVLWDERLTTVEAQRTLHAAGRNAKQSRRVIDQVAAQILLQDYLDAQALAGGE